MPEPDEKEKQEEERRWRESVAAVRAVAKKYIEAAEAGKEPDYAELPRVVEKMPFLGLQEELETAAGV
jgi:hypothetical protein